MLILLLITATGAFAQVVINEFCASNSALITDPDYGEYSDWLELCNLGDSEVNLKGYYITDNLGIPDKWRISDNFYISPGGHVLIWTDDMAAGIHTNFKLSADGEEIGLYSPALELLDSVSFTAQKSDVSYGRVSDGSVEWGYFPKPTPGASNLTESFAGITYILPSFSKTGGLYTSSQTVEILDDMGGEVRFTLDGTEPDLNSQLYTNPLICNSTTILRARIFEENRIPGPVVTQSYFINENSAGGKLPVVSIATDPANFWDPEVGIYVQDFKPLWEVPINIELFENNGTDRAAFNLAAGTKVNGLYSWQLPQKMLGIYFRGAYGDGSLDYPLINQRKRNSYKNFALRASGSDWSYTIFRDILGQSSTLYNMDIDIMGYKPAILFVNGQYMGINNIREKVDDDYIEKSYGLEPGAFDMVENEDFAETGSLDQYNYLLTLLGKDLSVQANFEAVTDLIDIRNFTDYAITELAVGNSSVDHNVMAWKPLGYGKWRWILMDLDRGFFNPMDHLIGYYIARDPLLLEELMVNQGYKDYFARRLAAQLYTSYNPERMINLVDEHARAIEAEIPYHIDRWQGTTSSYGNAIPSIDYWRGEVERMKVYLVDRPVHLLTDLASYGYGEVANLGLKVLPAGSGIILLDSLKVPGSDCFGPYTTNMDINLLARDLPGKGFKGWRECLPEVIISTGDSWKYFDLGTYPGSGWTDSLFNDTGWSAGNAQLGYGDDDEVTVVDFGGDTRNKYITTYFRKKFMVTEGQVNDGKFVIRLLKDDGAVVYINGKEVIRSNMKGGNIDFSTRSLNDIGGFREDMFIGYPVPGGLITEGENIMAVEVHQASPTSSDISFDLELVAYLPDNSAFLSASRELNIQLTADRYLVAEYETNSNCVIPDTVTEDMVLGLDCSPWLVAGDVFIASSATLEIEPGVEIWMPEGASMYVEGEMDARGTSAAGISFKLNPGDDPGQWGGIIFRNTEKVSRLSYVSIEDASGGPDPLIQNAAISAFYADLVLDHMTITDVHSNPILARYSDITLTNSNLHSKVTGDLINVKYGHAYIENCDFKGNSEIDTDAIDYDGIENGVITNCRISEFYGFNSDAVDIGENARNIVIDSIFVYNVTDKGVSIGQRSTATITNSVFINCNMGIALKDSCQALVNHCLFYGNVQAIASYEKNPGHAGGNGIIRNSIMSNSSDAPYFVDSKSTVLITYSLSDNTPLPDQSFNLNGNPLFERPSFFDFEVLPASPVILSGSENGTPVNMGIEYSSLEYEPMVMFYQIFINAANLNLPEFITLYNPSDETVDLGSYMVDRGVTITIPEGTMLGPKEILYLTNNSLDNSWWQQDRPVLQWEDGKLSNNGEALQLRNNHGIVIDFVSYQNNGLWPLEGFSFDGVFQLIDPAMDNHFPESWTSGTLDTILDTTENSGSGNFIVYPNPTSGEITIKALDYENQYADIFNLAGHMVGKVLLDQKGMATADLSVYETGILLIRLGNEVRKVVIIR